MGGGRDWSALKSEYAVGTLSYRKLAEKHGVSFYTLRERAKRDDWPGARKAYRDKVVQKTVHKAASKAATTHAKQVARLQRLNDGIAAMIEAALADAEAAFLHLVQTRAADGAQDVVEKRFRKPDTKGIRELAAALRDIQYTIRDAYSLPTLQEKAAMDIAAQRLELDRAKAVLDAPDDAQTGVVEIAAVADAPGDGAGIYVPDGADEPEGTTTYTDGEAVE